MTWPEPVAIRENMDAEGIDVPLGTYVPVYSEGVLVRELFIPEPLDIAPLSEAEKIAIRRAKHRNR